MAITFHEIDKRVLSQGSEKVLTKMRNHDKSQEIHDYLLHSAICQKGCKSNEFYNDDIESLHEATKPCNVVVFEFPIMVYRIFHVIQSLLKISIQGNMKHNTTHKSG